MVFYLENNFFSNLGETFQRINFLERSPSNFIDFSHKYLVRLVFAKDDKKIMTFGRNRGTTSIGREERGGVGIEYGLI